MARTTKQRVTKPATSQLIGKAIARDREGKPIGITRHILGINAAQAEARHPQQHRIRAMPAALQHTVARVIHHEHIIAGPARHGIGTSPAIQRVISGIAHDRIIPGITEDRVIARKRINDIIA